MNNNRQPISPEKHLFQQFWNQYTKNFFNYNIAQFAQLSAHFKMSMPMPKKIQELGELHLRNFFDAVWVDSEKVEPANQLMFKELQQQPKPSEDEPGPSYYQRIPTRSNFRNDAHPYHTPSQRGRGRPRKFNGPRNRYQQPRQQQLTNWSDDESSERAATSDFRVKEKNDFNKIAVNILGFRGDSSDDGEDGNRN